ncbi:hypothetical protein Tco_0037070 [Tanacetum coccineum]
MEMNEMEMEEIEMEEMEMEGMETEEEMGITSEDLCMLENGNGVPHSQLSGEVPSEVCYVHATEQCSNLVELPFENNWDLGCLCHELDIAHEADDRGVLSKKRDLEDGNRVMELGCERK